MTCQDKNEVLVALHRLLLKGEILVWDPNSKELRGSEGIAGISMNGNAIQISLTDDRPRRKALTG